MVGRKSLKLDLWKPGDLNSDFSCAVIVLASAEVGVECGWHYYSVSICKMVNSTVPPSSHRWHYEAEIKTVVLTYKLYL